MAHHGSWRIAVGMVLVLGASGGAAAQSVHEQTLDVRLKKDQLSVAVDAVPLVDVLNAIAERTGAELRVRGDPGSVRPQAFTDKPLAEAIRQLVEPNSFALSFAPAQGPDDVPRLATLTVYAATAHARVEAKAEPTQQPSPADPQEPAGRRLPDMRGFARGGDEDLVAALSRALMHDPGALRPGAATAGAQRFEDPDDLGAHRAVLASENPAERIEALHAISSDVGSRALGPLLQALVGDHDPDVRRTAVQILAGFVSEDAQAALEGALSDPDPSVRAAAAQALTPGNRDVPQ